MLKSIIYELNPTAEQRSHIRRACGSARYVYNKALALKKEKYEKEKVSLSKYDIDKMITVWKQTDTFLSECPIQALQQKVHDMCDAFVNMKKTKAGFPKFKKKGKSRETFRIPVPCQTFILIPLSTSLDWTGISYLSSMTTSLLGTLPTNPRTVG